MTDRIRSIRPSFSDRRCKCPSDVRSRLIAFLEMPRLRISAGLILVFIFANFVVANANAQQINELRETQKKVIKVVEKTMPACVAVRDGEGFGSGVIVSKTGLVLTAGHVMAGVPGKDELEIIMPSGKTVKARRLGKNLDVDSGMLQITESGDWPFVQLAAANQIKPGDWVVSLGHSGGYELGRTPPVRTGRILSIHDHQMLTDAVLIGGDSGGPLFNLDGELVAIHSSIGDSVSENRHVTIETFTADWKRLLSGESWGSLPELNEPGKSKRRGKIGVTVDQTTPRANIKSVKEGSPAAEAGIRVNDVVIEFDNIVINDGKHLIEIIKRKSAGEVYPIAISRNGNVIRFDIQLR